MATAAMTALGNDTMRPTRAAARPRRSVGGPIVTRSADVESVAMRTTAVAERKPAMVHTAVETYLGLMPVRRARSGLATEARTASPNLVWPSNHHNPTVMTGTRMSASTWAPLTVTPAPGCHWPLIGSGYTVCNVPVR